MENKTSPAIISDKTGTSDTQNKTSSTSHLFGPFRENFQWWMLLLGTIFLLAGYILPVVVCMGEYWELFLNIIKGMGELVIIGVLFGFLSTHNTIINNYHKKIVDLFYQSDHLANIKDISGIWNRVTDALVKYKFPRHIKDKMFAKIKGVYLPDKNYCYENYRDNITISWSDCDKTKVIVETENKMDIIPMQSKTITLEYTFSASDDSHYKITTSEFYLDENPLCPEKSIIKERNGNSCEKFKYVLSGQDIYHLTRKTTKTYNMKADGRFLAVVVQAVTHIMSVNLFHPDDMDVQFLELGTSEDFDIIFKKATSCSYRLEEIVMPQQGYCFIFEKKQ